MTTTPKRTKTQTPKDGQLVAGPGLVIMSTCPWRADLTAELSDDGRVAYAYIRSYKQLTGEVWLYNHGPPDDVVEWNQRGATGPFRNPTPFASTRVEVPATSAADVTFEWTIVDTGPEVRIALRGRALAHLRPFEKPGRCANAAANGPVARVLEGGSRAREEAGGADAD